MFVTLILPYTTLDLAKLIPGVIFHFELSPFSLSLSLSFREDPQMNRTLIYELFVGEGWSSQDDSVVPFLGVGAIFRHRQCRV